MSIPIIGPAVTLVAKLLKGKKPFQLWYLGQDMVYRKKGKPMSSRQCRKELAKLVVDGYEKERFRIYRDGTDPNKHPKE